MRPDRGPHRNAYRQRPLLRLELLEVAPQPLCLCHSTKNGRERLETPRTWVTCRSLAIATTAPACVRGGTDPGPRHAGGNPHPNHRCARTGYAASSAAHRTTPARAARPGVDRAEPPASSPCPASAASAGNPDRDGAPLHRRGRARPPAPRPAGNRPAPRHGCAIRSGVRLNHQVRVDEGQPRAVRVGHALLLAAAKPGLSGLPTKRTRGSWLACRCTMSSVPSSEPLSITRSRRCPAPGAGATGRHRWCCHLVGDDDGGNGCIQT